MLKRRIFAILIAISVIASACSLNALNNLNMPSMAPSVSSMPGTVSVSFTPKLLQIPMAPIHVELMLEVNPSTGQNVWDLTAYLGGNWIQPEDIYVVVLLSGQEIDTSEEGAFESSLTIDNSGVGKIHTAGVFSASFNVHDADYLVFVGDLQCPNVFGDFYRASDERSLSIDCGPKRPTPTSTWTIQEGVLAQQTMMARFTENAPSANMTATAENDPTLLHTYTITPPGPGTPIPTLWPDNPDPNTPYENRHFYAFLGGPMEGGGFSVRIFPEEVDEEGILGVGSFTPVEVDKVLPGISGEVVVMSTAVSLAFHKMTTSSTVIIAESSQFAFTFSDPANNVFLNNPVRLHFSYENQICVVEEVDRNNAGYKFKVSC